MAREPEAEDCQARTFNRLEGLIQHIGKRANNFLSVMLDTDIVPKWRGQVPAGLIEYLAVRTDDHGLGGAASLINAYETIGWHESLPKKPVIYNCIRFRSVRQLEQ